MISEVGRRKRDGKKDQRGNEAGRKMEREREEANTLKRRALR